MGVVEEANTYTTKPDFFVLLERLGFVGLGFVFSPYNFSPCKASPSPPFKGVGASHTQTSWSCVGRDKELPVEIQRHLILSYCLLKSHAVQFRLLECSNQFSFNLLQLKDHLCHVALNSKLLNIQILNGKLHWTFPGVQLSSVNMC